MQPSSPNENGVLPNDHHEIVARRGRSYAEISIALGEDGRYHYATELHYSYGGFSGPIFECEPGYATIDAARTAALEELLHRWRKPFPSEPASVHTELAELRQQVESRLLQPSLF